MLNSTQLMYYPTRIFLTTNNTWYIVADAYALILSGIEGTIISTVVRNGGFAIFVAANGDMYSSDSLNSQVNTWSVNENSSSPVLFISDRCADIFIDTNSTLYCAISGMHRIISKALDDPMNTLRTVAGTGCYGLVSDSLAYPQGVFVDLSFSLYVADSSNNRIQRFNQGQMNAVTVAGNGAPSTIGLSAPTDVLLDGNGYIFIADLNSHRIIGSGPNGFRCVAGCTNSEGSASNQLRFPKGISFDSHGNIWVADSTNQRIQKFVLASNSCGTYSHIPTCKDHGKR